MSFIPKCDHIDEEDDNAYEDDADENKKEVELELDRQLEELYVVFGFRSISVLRYLTDHTGVLSLGVLARCPFCLLWVHG